MSSTEHTIFYVNSRDGFFLTGRYWTAPQPKAVIAVVHGLTEHSGRYERFALAAVENGFCVVSIDLRGHGCSFGDRAYVERFSDYLLDADALMGKARKLAGDLPLFLMGHSMGGAVAMRWMDERQPYYLAGLVLSSAALQIGKGIPRAGLALAPLASRLIPRFRGKNTCPSWLSRDANEVEAYCNDPLVCRTTPARTAAELLWAIKANRRAAPLQSVPIYLIHGGDDKVADPEGSRDLYAAWGCRDKTLRIWPESRHEALNDLDRELVMNEMFDWFSVKTAENSPALN